MNKESLLTARNFIYSDIQREISLVEATAKDEEKLRELKIIPGGGNFLAALGLLCYTEFVGKLKYNHLIKRGKRKGESIASANFNSFFDDLGDDYKKYRLSFTNPNYVYDRFRCGLAHEYFVKEFCQIAMFGNAPTGLGSLKDGSLYFVVKKYFDDFIKAFDQYISNVS